MFLPIVSLGPLTFGLLIALSVPAAAQAPSTATLTLSLRTISKALAACRVSYTQVQAGTTAPIVKLVVGPDGYDKDMKSLDTAERVTNFLVAHPDQITGKTLIAILSSSDDFSVGVGSTQSEILRSLIRQDSKVTPQVADELVPLATSLADCQKSLFNAGDDYVGLVMDFVGAEDEALAPSHHR